MLSPTDPFRFDDRTGHYGSGQADLAPVSPLAAAPREADDARPLDPMGGSPREGLSEAAMERPAPQNRAEVQTEARADADLNTTSQSGAIPSQPAFAADSTATVSVEAPQTPVRDEAASPQTVLLRTQTDARIEGDARADAAPAISSSGTPVSLLPDARPDPTESAGSFADMAARMDKMMAEIEARMDALSPWSRNDDDDDTEAGSNNTPDALAEAQDRLDNLFGSLSDRFGRDESGDGGDGDPFDAARDRLDDLAEGLNLTPSDRSDAGETDPLTQAAARLDDLKANLGRSDADDGPTAPSDPGGSLLARLFDGDAAPAGSAMEGRAAELFDGMDDLSIGSQTLGFDPGRWDDLPDFG